MPTDPPANAPDGPGLPLTGERTLPGIPDERYWFLRHVVAYRLAQDLVRDAGSVPVVLDAGCGEGYGLELLRQAGAQRVVGADLDDATVAHAQRRYATAGTGVEVVRAELRELPLADDEVDLTVSFQVIEHLHDIPGYLTELSRVTRPGAPIVIATPNRLTFTPDSDTPVNPFHTVEFTAAELAVLLTRAGLEHVTMAGVHHAGAVAAAERDHGVTLPRLLGSAPPKRWPGWARRLVHATEESDFAVLPAGDDRHPIDESLDLIATVRVPA